MSVRRARTIRRRLVLWGGAALAVLFAITLVVHIPAVQYAMGWTHPDGTGACPFGHGAKSRPAIARAPRTGPRAPARPALGFTLAATKRDDVLAWAKQHHIKCEAKSGQRVLECLDIPAELLAEHGARLSGTTTWFELDDTNTVTAIKTARRTPHPSDVASAFAATESLLRAQTGAPTTAAGSASPKILASALAARPFQQAMVEHAFADYRAQVRATNMGDCYLLTETYAAL